MLMALEHLEIFNPAILGNIVLASVPLKDPLLPAVAQQRAKAVT